MKPLRIATRQSPLALWQTEFVAKQLKQHHPALKIQLVLINTRGDQIQDRPLRDVGGKALFVKGLEVALLNDEADIAVHSMKDVPSVAEDGFCFPAICERHNPFDALVSNNFNSFSELPQGANVGSSSPRRQAQLLHARPDLKFSNLRGNVNTRLQKLNNGGFDAIILACAGLRRLAFNHRITEQLSPELCLPAASQGAIGIECFNSREDLKNLLAPINHQPTALCIEIERAICAGLNGDCHSPISVFAKLTQDQLSVTARVASLNGKSMIKAENQGSPEQKNHLTESILSSLNQQGAQTLLEKN